jgi:hypothetical protein
LIDLFHHHLHLPPQMCDWEATPAPRGDLLLLIDACCSGLWIDQAVQYFAKTNASASEASGSTVFIQTSTAGNQFANDQFSFTTAWLSFLSSPTAVERERLLTDLAHAQMTPQWFASSAKRPPFPLLGQQRRVKDSVPTPNFAASMSVPSSASPISSGAFGAAATPPARTAGTSSASSSSAVTTG